MRLLGRHPDIMKAFRDDGAAFIVPTATVIGWQGSAVFTYHKDCGVTPRAFDAFICDKVQEHEYY